MSKSVLPCDGESFLDTASAPAAVPSDARHATQIRQAAKALHDNVKTAKKIGLSVSFDEEFTEWLIGNSGDRDLTDRMIKIKRDY
jgi:hypothetical protein